MELFPLFLLCALGYALARVWEMLPKEWREMCHGLQWSVWISYCCLCILVLCGVHFGANRSGSWYFCIGNVDYVNFCIISNDVCLVH